MPKTKIRIGAKGLVIIIAALFVISWCALAAFSILYIGARAKYEAVRKTALALQQQLNTLNKQRQDPSYAANEQNEKQALDFLEWQFVLKEQVKAAGADLSERIAKLKDRGADKGLQALLYYNLGLNYFLAVDYQRAINAFEEALKLDPKDAASAYNLGLLYSVYGNDPQKAVACYRKYLELSPSAQNAESVKERIASLSHGK
jgi:tetratricopeptide (TPR) repeat protein